MFPDWAFSAFVRLSNAVRTDRQAVPTYSSNGVSKLSPFTIRDTRTQVSSSIKELVLIAARAVFWRSKAFLAIRTTSTATFIQRVYEIP